MLLTEGQMSGPKGARLMRVTPPAASTLIAERGYDSNWFRQALEAKGVAPCIPPAKSRKTQLDYDKMRIPIQSGRVLRFDAGHHSDLKPAAIPR